MSQNSRPLRQLRCAASSASTIASELMSSTNVLTDVSGMVRISCENGPTTLSRLYTMYVEINDPKNNVSEPRNTQKPSLNVFSPVAVGACTACASAKTFQLLFQFRDIPSPLVKPARTPSSLPQ